MPPQQGDDTLAWAGIASSVASWLTCCCTPIPFVGVIFALGGLLLAVVGVVCGFLAYRAAKPIGARTDLAIVGIAIGAARLIITFGVVAIALVVVGAAGIAAFVEGAH